MKIRAAGPSSRQKTEHPAKGGIAPAEMVRIEDRYGKAKRVTLGLAQRLLAAGHAVLAGRGSRRYYVLYRSWEALAQDGAELASTRQAIGMLHGASRALHVTRAKDQKGEAILDRARIAELDAVVQEALNHLLTETAPSTPCREATGR